MVLIFFYLHVYLALHVYQFLQNFLSYMFIPHYTFIWNTKVAKQNKIYLMINLPPYPNFIFVYILVTYNCVLNWQNLIILQSKTRMKMFEIMINYIFNCIAGLDLNFLRLCSLSCQKFVSPNSY